MRAARLTRRSAPTCVCLPGARTTSAHVQHLAVWRSASTPRVVKVSERLDAKVVYKRATVKVTAYVHFALVSLTQQQVKLTFIGVFRGRARRARNESPPHPRYQYPKYAHEHLFCNMIQNGEKSGGSFQTKNNYTAQDKYVCTLFVCLSRYLKLIVK